MTGSARFTIAVGRAVATVVVTVHGDLDRSSAKHLESMLTDLIDGQDAIALIIDLHDARVGDPVALSAFHRAAALARSRGGTLVLNNPPDAMHHALEKAGLMGLMSAATRHSYLDPGDDNHDGRSEHPAGGAHSRAKSGWGT